MNSRALKYEPMIRQLEGELTENTHEQEKAKHEIFQLQSKLKRLAEERIGWLQTISVAKARLGLPLTDEEREYLPADVKPINAVPSDLCKGKTLLEAAEAYLVWRDEPATHSEVVKGVLEGGLKVELRNLENSLRSAMGRSGLFVWFKDDEGTNRWAMPSWVNRSPQVDEAKAKPSLELVTGKEALAKLA